MSDMIERVRSAIAAEHNRQMQQGRLGQKIDTVAMARAAIEAMRDPSEAMDEAAKPFRKGVGEGAGRLWTAMIDQALRG